MFTVDY